MGTYYIRDRKSGEIVNAVEVDGWFSPEQQQRHLDRMTGDLYFDQHPPLEVLKRYRYWDERP